MRTLYYVGRTLQALALFVMPFAMWVGHFGHNETGSVLIFFGSIALFFFGWWLTKKG
jgi:hypothetical protein